MDIVHFYSHKDIDIQICSKNNFHMPRYHNCNFLQNGENLVVAGFIKPNSIVIDAGAHVGEWTKSVFSATNSNCYIYAFEPVPSSYQKLYQLTHTFKDKLFTFNIALGKEDDELEMNYLFKRGSDSSTFFHRPDLSNVPSKKIKVPVTYLDKFVVDHNICHIDFLKIDTEGSEWNILMGSRNLIEQNKIDIIQFEYGVTTADAKITLHQIYDYLTVHYYLIFRIYKQGLIYIPQ